MRTHAAWNVETHILRATGPTSAATRLFISSAALLVNVMARISNGETPRSLIRYATRWVSTRVFPEPAPATSSRGPPGWVTASRWTGFRCSRRSLPAITTNRGLLPLDGARWLRRHIERHPVHARHLVDEPGRHALEHVVGEAGPVRGHGVVAGDGADDDRVGVRPLVAHHADGAHRRQHREALPELAVQPGPLDLLGDDGVGAAQHLEPLGRDRAHAAHPEAGAGERLAPHDL